MLPRESKTPDLMAEREGFEPPVAFRPTAARWPGDHADRARLFETITAEIHAALTECSHIKVTRQAQQGGREQADATPGYGEETILAYHDSDSLRSRIS